MRSTRTSPNRLFLIIATTIITIGSLSTFANAAALLIPTSGHRDHAYDISRDLLYITTNSGQILRYDMAARDFITPCNVGVSLNGIDLTKDGNFAYVAEGQAGPTEGYIRKVNLNTGTHVNIAYTKAFGESGAYDVATAGSKVFFTTRYSGSGWTPMRVIDTSDDSMQEVRSRVRQNTNLSAAADGSKVFYTESNSSGGPAGIIDVPTLDILPTGFNTSLSSTQHAMSRNGQLIAIEFGGTSILDDQLNTVEILPAYSGGLAFNPVRDILYAAAAGTDELVALDTTTFNELYRMDAGGDIAGSTHFGAGPMTVSPDGRYVFLNTAEGVRVFEVNDVPEPASILTLLAGVAAFTQRRR